MEIEKNNQSAKEVLLCVLVGAVSGLINGLFGGGGGMVVVPLLEKVLKRDPDKAHATAVLIILPISIVSTIFYLTLKNVELSVCLPTCIGTVLGGVLGSLILSKISSKTIVKIFSAVMFAAGVKLAFF